ncbi:MAG: glycosyltransferase family 39 protein [Candidatus Methylomirabilales bacterium]
MIQATFAHWWQHRLRSWVPFTLLAMIPLFYAMPLIGLGMEDLHAVRHLDEGEFTILRAWKDVYPNGPLYAGPFDLLHIYPKAFYNLAGVILYPYSYFWGEDFQTILIVWRSMNALFGMGAVLMLFFLVRRVFHSNAAAFLAAGLFAITPDFLTWTANVRPNPFEQMLVFATLLTCVLLCERFSYRLFLLASLTGALAFASKYGGLPFLVLVPVLSVYLIWRRDGDQDQLTSVVRQQTRILQCVFPLLFGVIGVGLVMFAWLFYRQGWDGVALFISLSHSAFPPELVPKVVAKLNRWRLFVGAVPWGFLVFLLVVQASLVIFWRWSKKWMSGTAVRPGIVPYAFLLGVFLIQTAGIYAATFFITGPAYVANPEHFVSQVGFMTYYSGLAGSYGNRPPPGFLESLRGTAAEAPGWWLFLPLVGYAGFVQVRGRDISAVDYDRRIVLWSYVLISITVFLGTRVVVVRHILPTIGLLYGFLGYAVVRKIEDWRTGLPAKAISAALMVLLMGYTGTSLTAALEGWQDKRGKTSDIGFAVGEWLRANYDPRTRILTDHWTFYTPPEFQNVSTTTYAEWKGKSPREKEWWIKDLVVTFNPEIVIVTDDKKHTKLVHLDQVLFAHPALRVRGYRLIKRFDSRRRGDRLANVRIYEAATLRPRSS